MAKPQHSQTTDLDQEDDQIAAPEPQQTERKGAVPATAPASEPAAAVARPASEGAPKAQRSIISNIRDPKIPFEDDADKVLVGMDEGRAKDLMRTVPCHVIETFSGRTKNKFGSFTPFKFLKNEVVGLPKWFALSHSTRLVIKE